MTLFQTTVATVAIVGMVFISLPFFLLLMRLLGIGRKLLCRIGWHSPGSKWRFINHDGASKHVECPWCRYRGMVDSQGNLF